MIWKLSNQSGRYGARARAFVGALVLALFASLPGVAQVAPTPNVANTPIGEVNTEGLRPTYYQCSIVSITAAGDTVILQGSATRTIRITQVYVNSLATAGSTYSLALLRRSTAPTGGTTGGAQVLAKGDTNDPAPTATFTSYTTPPTAGTSAGITKAIAGSVGAIGGTTPVPPIIIDFATRAEKAFLLRGTSDYFAVNTNNFGAGNASNICLTWIEE